MILLPVADRTIEETGLANNTNTCLSAHALSGIFLPAVQTNGRACHQQRYNDCGTAEGATPATAQAQRTIGTGKSGERRYHRPPKGHTTQVVISQVPRTDGAQREIVLRLFSF